MKQTCLNKVLWTIQTQLEEQVLKPMKKLLHHSYGDNIRFFSGSVPPTEKKSLATNLEVVSTLIRSVQDYESHLASEEQETAADDHFIKSKTVGLLK